MERVYNRLCFECRACEQICNKKAISMIEDNEGFSYPVIDQNKCIDCGLCQTVCPGNHSEILKQKQKFVFAVQSNNRTTLSDSSSGGVFSLIAEHVINGKGVVYGATLDENLICHHIRVESKDELQKLRGSKYVHSDVGSTFVEIRKLLNSQRLVYFVGTPCQVAGLKLYLRKDYENLITSDLICHGTPSQRMFYKFVTSAEQELGTKLTNWKFRDKKSWGWSKRPTIVTKNFSGSERLHISNRHAIAYYNAFMEGYLFRKDCYDCPFSCPERVSDITLADYWGVKKFHSFENSREGISLVIVNTDKGKKIWEALKNQTSFYNSKMEYALQTVNTNLYKSSPMPTGRVDSYMRLNDDYESFIQSFLTDYSPWHDYYLYYKRKLKRWLLSNR